MFGALSKREYVCRITLQAKIIFFKKTFIPQKFKTFLFKKPIYVMILIMQNMLGKNSLEKFAKPYCQIICRNSGSSTVTVIPKSVATQCKICFKFTLSIIFVNQILWPIHWIWTFGIPHLFGQVNGAEGKNLRNRILCVTGDGLKNGFCPLVCQEFSSEDRPRRCCSSSKRL